MNSDQEEIKSEQPQLSSESDDHIDMMLATKADY